MATGKIEPFEKFNKASNIAEASSLSIQIDDTMDEETKKLYVYTNIVNALLVSGQRFNSDDALIQKAKNLGNKLLDEIKKP